MNTKLFLTALLLPMVINCINVGQAMTYDGDIFYQEQHDVSTLAKMKQDLDTQIDKLVEILMDPNEDQSLVHRKILEAIHSIIDSGKIDVNNIDNYSSFLEFHELFKVSPRNNGRLGARKPADSDIYSRVKRKNLENDQDFFKLFVKILKSVQQINNLEQHPE